MNLEEKIRRAISPKQYAMEKGISYSRARNKFRQKEYREVVDRWVSKKAKEVISEYESLSSK